MNILNKLTIKNLMLNKKRTIVTIIGIILSVALICALSSMVVSFKESIIIFEKQELGDFHYAYYGVDGTEIKSFSNNRNIDSYYLTKEIGYSYLKDSKNPDKVYAYITAFDASALKNLSISLIDGRYPNNENEIVIPRHLKTNGGIDLKIGDTITLDIGKRYSDGYFLVQNNPYTGYEEELKVEQTHTFKVVGIIERPGKMLEPYSAPGYTFITKLDTKSYNGKYNVYTRYTDPAVKDRFNVTANILGVDSKAYERYELGDLGENNEVMNEVNKSKYEVVCNYYLITLETLSFDNSTMNMLYSISAVIIIIIMVTSIYCIKNSFDISITEKTKQYGMLRSIGATSKQIKKNVLNEAYILWLIGAPVGILCGIFAAFVLIKVSNHFLGDLLVSGALIFKTSILAIVLSIILSFITIYFSALKIARRASKLSPMSAIRSQDDIKIKSKKIRSPKYIQKLFGIGGIISYKNIKRNRKKYRTTVISIVVSVSVFIGLYYFMGLGRKTIELELGQMTHNIELSVNNKDYNKIKSILNFDNISKYSVRRTTQYSINDNLYTKEYMKFYDDSLKDTTIEVYAFGKSEYIRYINKLKLRV